MVKNCWYLRVVHKIVSDLTIGSSELADWAPTHRCDPSLFVFPTPTPAPYLTDQPKRTLLTRWGDWGAGAHSELGVLHSPLGIHEGEWSKMSSYFPRASPQRTSQETSITASEYWACSAGVGVQK